MLVFIDNNAPPSGWVDDNATLPIIKYLPNGVVGLDTNTVSAPALTEMLLAELL